MKVKILIILCSIFASISAAVEVDISDISAPAEKSIVLPIESPYCLVQEMILSQNAFRK